MKRKILILLALAALMTLLCCGAALADGPYLFNVRIYDCSNEHSYFGSCNNSAGYIVVPTVKQDGTPGETWWAKVNAGDWDEAGGFFYYGNHTNGKVSQDESLWASRAIDGFPTQVLFVKDNSATSTNYMTNDNTFYKSRIEVCIQILEKNGSFLQNEFFWYEETNIYGKFSDLKTVDKSKATPHNEGGRPVSEFCVRRACKFRRLAGGKSRNLQDAYGGKGTTRRAAVLCGVALITRSPLPSVK